jgi:hypothetical protein
MSSLTSRRWHVRRGVLGRRFDELGLGRVGGAQPDDSLVLIELPAAEG